MQTERRFDIRRLAMEADRRALERAELRTQIDPDNPWAWYELRKAEAALGGQDG